MEKQKKIALINDISCLGRCSLTAAMPIISACGFEAVPLPTGVFSAHTEFERFVCADLTDKMQPITDHWKQLGTRFDGICTGYIATKKQADIIKRFLIDFKKSDTFCLVDPVMGDNGSFYKRIDEDFVSEMRFFCSMADVIVPNVTEAEMLAGLDCTKPPYSLDRIKEILLKLTGIGAPKIVITGVESEDGQIGCAVYDNYTKKANMFFTPKTEGRFPGTGDVFTAVLMASMMKGKDFFDSVQIAMGFTCECVEKTAEAQTDRKYGLCFEPQIGKLIKAIK